MRPEARTKTFATLILGWSTGQPADIYIKVNLNLKKSTGQPADIYIKVNLFVIREFSEPKIEFSLFLFVCLFVC